MIWDCIIIGGGPAGLTAGLYLARFRRSVLVLDNNKSRASLIPTSHNYPGFPEGINGNQLLDNLRAQAARYGCDLKSEEVVALKKDASHFIIDTKRAKYCAKKIILATGVEDIEPELPDIPNAIARGLVRHCPICDAYEVINQRIAVIGYGAKGLREAVFLRTYSNDVSLLSLGRPLKLSETDYQQAQRLDIKLVDKAIDKVAIENNMISAICIENNYHRFDTIYSALGANNRSQLAAEIGVTCNEQGCIKVDDHQQTSINGLYAAGDIVSSLSQICVATSQAAVASTAIHNALREEEGLTI